jgi:hypothetical protein
MSGVEFVLQSVLQCSSFENKFSTKQRLSLRIVITLNLVP